MDEAKEEMWTVGVTHRRRAIERYINFIDPRLGNYSVATAIFFSLFHD